MIYRGMDTTLAGNGYSPSLTLMGNIYNPYRGMYANTIGK